MPSQISEWMIRRRAEHNEGMLSNLEEVALHQQNIEKIELLGQLCPHLKIIYLQNNLIGKIQNLHKLKELEYLNLAVNNVTRIQNLQRCESLKKLDLTINFVDKSGLLTVSSLQANINLTELTLMGNPCTEWSGYRPYVIAKLGTLKKLDGVDVKHSERIAALQQLPELEAQLRKDVTALGMDPDKAAEVEDDSIYDENGEVKETGAIDVETGEMKRPWCPATRILDHLENEKANREAEDRKKAGSQSDNQEKKPVRLEEFPDLKEGERVMQRNEGRWDFSMEESEDGKFIVMEVDVGKYLDTSLIKADVQPSFIRLLIKGKLLQLLLPCEVRAEAANAQRSTLTGRLVLTMPKEDPAAEPNVALIRPKQPTQQVPGTAGGGMTAVSTTTVQGTVAGAGPLGNAQTGLAAGGKAAGSLEFTIREIRKAQVQAVHLDDDDYIPDL